MSRLYWSACAALFCGAMLTVAGTAYRTVGPSTMIHAATRLGTVVLGTLVGTGAVPAAASAGSAAVAGSGPVVMRPAIELPSVYGTTMQAPTVGGEESEPPVCPNKPCCKSGKCCAAGEGCKADHSCCADADEASSATEPNWAFDVFYSALQAVSNAVNQAVPVPATASPTEGDTEEAEAVHEGQAPDCTETPDYQHRYPGCPALDGVPNRHRSSIAPNSAFPRTKLDEKALVPAPEDTGSEESETAPRKKPSLDTMEFRPEEDARYGEFDPRPMD